MNFFIFFKPHIRSMLWGFFLSFYFSGCAALIPPKALTIKPLSNEIKTYRGIFHVHTIFSGDSKTTLEEVRDVARESKLDFVVITDHNNLKAQNHLPKITSMSSNPLLIIGTELTTSSGHMILAGVSEMPPATLNVQQVADWVRARGGISILAHPFSLRTPWSDWSLKNFDGMEIYNFAHDFYRENRLKIMAKLSFLFPKSFLRSFQKNPVEALEKWDELLKERNVSIVGAVDSHLKFKELGVSFVGLPIQFQAVTLYVFSHSLEENSILESIKLGRSYIAKEALGVAKDFVFKVSDNQKVYYAGESLPYSKNLFLEIVLPKQATIRLIHNGLVLKESKGLTQSVNLENPGYYRVEVYQGKRLWILSNPIYIGR